MKNLWLALVLLALPACGFTPLYAPMDGGENPAQILSSIDIPPIPDRSGVILRNALIDRFHPHGAGDAIRAALTIAPISESMTDLDITPDGEATRRQLRIQTTYTLTSQEPGATAFSRSVYALVSFNVLQSRFTTRVAEDNARENALNDLARQIEQGVLLHLSGAGHS